MTVDLEAELLSFTLEPHSLAIDTKSIVADIRTNDPPIDFGIALEPHGESLAFSYRLRRDGAGLPPWREIPIFPSVSLKKLHQFGEIRYILDLRASAEPDVPSGSYEGELQLQFSILNITRIYTLPIEVAVKGWHHRS